MKVSVEKSSNFTIMSNHHFRNSGLSFKAMGLLSFMLSLPEYWDFSVEGLTQCAKDGRDSITTGLRELEQKGYLIRRKVRNERGRIIDVEYIVFEEPQIMVDGGKENDIEEPITDFPETGKSDTTIKTDKPENVINTAFSPETENPEMVNFERIYPFTEKPITENPATEKPITEKPQQLNTNILNTNILNTKEINKDDLSSSSNNTYIALYESLDYDAAVNVSSVEIADGVLDEISKHPEIYKAFTADMFKRLCENIALYSKQMNNRHGYIRACISNMLDASKINKSTFSGSFTNPPRKEDGYISLSG